MIGYEFEVLSLLDDDEIIVDLRKIFGNAMAKQFIVTTDCSIKRDKQTKAADGWSGWEIITPPLPNDQALLVLSKVQEYLSQPNFITNKSCGFHVNVSVDDMSSFSPMTLISLIDEYKFAKTYNREDNAYCVLWSYYFSEIWKRVKRNKLTIDKKEAFCHNMCMLVDSAARNEFLYPTPDNKHAYNVSKFFDEKYLSINVSKLSLKSPYVEFRMLGGKDYHQTMLLPLVKELTLCVEEAALGINKKTISKYASQFQT